jgi:hypothetical protein
MKRNVFAFMLVALMSVTGLAMADEPAPNPHPLRVGFGMDLGLPSGVALGVVVHPKIDWVSASVALTHNVLAFGGRASVKLDPLALLPKVPVGLFADFQGGFAGQGAIPGHADLPTVGYDYFNMYGGLRLGRPNGFHWNFEVGPTYLHVATENFQHLVASKTQGLTVGNPTVNGWVTPTFVTGFEVVWP